MYYPHLVVLPVHVFVLVGVAIRYLLPPIYTNAMQLVISSAAQAAAVFRPPDLCQCALCQIVHLLNMVQRQQPSILFFPELG